MKGFDTHKCRKSINPTIRLEINPETLLTDFGLGIDVDVAQGSSFNPAALSVLFSSISSTLNPKSRKTAGLRGKPCATSIPNLI
jgi:hypothetical protein